MRHFFLLSLILILGSLTAACSRSTVPFRQGAPYNSPHKIPEALIISMPDDLEKETYDVNVGSFPSRHRHRIYIMDAYAAEANPRLRGLFTQGVILVPNSRLGDINAAEKRIANDPTERSVLDLILDDMEAAEKTAEKKRDLRPQDQRLQDAETEFIATQGPRYLLVYREALLGMSQDRPRVSFVVSFFDRDTNTKLFERRYQGTGSKVDFGQDQTANGDRLAESIRLSFASPMTQLVNDIATVTGYHSNLR